MDAKMVLACILDSSVDKQHRMASQAPNDATVDIWCILKQATDESLLN